MNRILLFICIASFFSCEREKLSWDKEKIVPKLSGCVVSNITANNTLLEARTINNGGLDITEYGFCFSEGDSTHFVKENKVTCTPKDWKMKSQLQDLKEGTKYYVKAYAVNSAGVGYSEVASFDTKLLPVAVTDTAVNITNSSAKFSGVVLFDGGAKVTESGICVSTSIQNLKYTSGIASIYGSGIGQFSGNNTWLSAKTLYFYRAFAKTEYGIGYGEIKSFVTGQ